MNTMCVKDETLCAAGSARCRSYLEVTEMHRGIVRQSSFAASSAASKKEGLVSYPATLAAFVALKHSTY